MCLRLLLASDVPLTAHQKLKGSMEVGLMRASRRDAPAEMADAPHLYDVRDFECACLFTGSNDDPHVVNARQTLRTICSDALQRQGKPTLYFAWLGERERERLLTKTLKVDDLTRGQIWREAPRGDIFARVTA